ncbi:YkgJ family cysteine cluster protein [Haloarchaeobius sp. TZWWS8]|uniref:YkgJ family cysteine cluster protein n=1 Tax=Haloarchaeobius sp. TZWWS8 TaxID=3446121 RepID=UPI003EB77F08
MEVNCEGCAGCCIDWRPLSDQRESHDHERRGPHQPIDDTYNLVPLTRDKVRAFCDAGLGDVLVPRLWLSDGDDGAEVDGYTLAAVGGKPAFFVGLRKPPKPLAPFDIGEERWLRACTFLDPTTLQCRIHESELYPTECRDYPGHNLVLDQETECERVEREYGGDRLVDDTPPEGVEGLILGPQAVGHKVFVHPEPADLAGVVRRAIDRELTDDDRAELVATAAASAPGTTERSESHYRSYRESVRTTASWAGEVVDEWESRAGMLGDSAPDAALAETVEEARGAPATPGWVR